MNIKVVFFASLRERMGMSACEVKLDTANKVSDLWAVIAGNDTQEEVLCAVNHELSSYAHQLNDGDEVAFFPPVTGG
ncbi:MAG: MoaD/ThiS family protein [Gammaproteobacteria bacterium]|nr:MAG: MoaD/ThiS family protein [Gammaproteobacteria bacterium]